MPVPIELTPHICKGGIMILDCDLKSTMYTNQTGLFPQILSLGNRYVMIRQQQLVMGGSPQEQQ